MLTPYLNYSPQNIHTVFFRFVLLWLRVQIPVVSHYNDVIMSAMASQITNFTIVYSTLYLGADQRKHQSSAPLAFVWEIHWWPVNSPHKGPVTRKMFPFDDIIMGLFDPFTHNLQGRFAGSGSEVTLKTKSLCSKTPLLARFIGPTWGPSGADRTQVGPMLAPRTLLSGTIPQQRLSGVHNPWGILIWVLSRKKNTYAAYNIFPKSKDCAWASLYIYFTGIGCYMFMSLSNHKSS